MKRTPVLLAAVILVFSLFATPRGAMSGPFPDIGTKLEGNLAVDGRDPAPTPPPPEPSIFATLEKFTGKVTSMSATPVGNYACQGGVVQFVPGVSFGLKLIRGGEDTPAEDLILRNTPVKLTVAVGNVTKIVLIPEAEAERFKATLSILHAARLTNTKEVTIQAVAIPNCPNANVTAYYAADVTINN